jgi:hypothetical protein
MGQSNPYKILKELPEIKEMCKNENDGEEKIRKNAIRMNKLMIWQRNLNQYDQYMRKMLAIKELDDVPYEVWMEIIYDRDINRKWKSKFMKYVQQYGTCEYTKEVKEECMRDATKYYARHYMKLHGIKTFREAEIWINQAYNEEYEKSIR